MYEVISLVSSVLHDKSLGLWVGKRKLVWCLGGFSCLNHAEGFGFDSSEFKIGSHYDGLAPGLVISDNLMK